MPINPSIALQVQGPAPLDPFEWMQKSQQLRAGQAIDDQRRQALKDKQDKDQEEEAISRAIQGSVNPQTGAADYERAASQLEQQGIAGGARAIRTFMVSQNKEHALALKDQTEAQNNLLSQASRLIAFIPAGSLDPATGQPKPPTPEETQMNQQRYASILPRLQTIAKQIDEKLPGVLPAAYDPIAFEGIRGWTKEGSDALSLRQNAFDDYIKAQDLKLKQGGDARAQQQATDLEFKSVGTLVSSAKNPQQQQEFLSMAKSGGAPDWMVSAFSSVSPQQAGQMVTSPEVRQKLIDDARGLTIREGELGVAQTREKREGAAAADKAKPLDLAGGNWIKKTASGTPYVSAADFQTAADREKASEAARAAGVPFVDQKTDDGLRAADSVRSTMKGILQQIESKLPKDAAGRVIVGPENKLSQFFQTDPVLGANGSWRTAAIRTVQALAEPGMGLRINQAEINAAMENDIPQPTDTVGTAKQRIQNLMKMLDDKEQAILTRDRTQMPGMNAAPAGYTLMKGPDGRTVPVANKDVPAAQQRGAVVVR